jgi:hypothetical protein
MLQAITWPCRDTTLHHQSLSLSPPRKRGSRVSDVQLPWTPAFAGVTTERKRDHTWSFDCPGLPEQAADCRHGAFHIIQGTALDGFALAEASDQAASAQFAMQGREVARRFQQSPIDQPIDGNG